MVKRGKSLQDSTKAIQVKADRMVKRLRWFYSLGIESRETKSSVRQFASDKGISPATAWKARAFADKYTPSQLDALCEIRRKNGLPLHWGYVCYLVTVDKASVRRELTKEVVEHGWTSPELHAEIKRRYSRRGNAGAGRKRKIPATTIDRLRMIANDVAAWSRRCQWLADEMWEPPPSLNKTEDGIRKQARKELADIQRRASILSSRLAKPRKTIGK